MFSLETRLNDKTYNNFMISQEYKIPSSLQYVGYIFSIYINDIWYG